MIELHLLRYVQAAAETGSFSRAADRFGVKQTTLSSGIQYLESRLGLSLFTRSTRGVTPTDPGQRFAKRAGSILDDVDRLLGDARSLARGESGVLRIGLYTSLTTGDLGTLLCAFRDRFPEVEIEASERNRSDLFRAVERGDLDVAVAAGAPPQATMKSLCLWNEPLIVALASDHPLAATDRLLWSDLRDASFVVTKDDPGPDIGAVIAARMAAPGPSLKISRQCVSRDNLLSFVRGDNIAVAIGFLSHRGPNAPALHHVHDAFGLTAIEQRLIWRHDNESVTLRRFLAMAAERTGCAFD